jgi:hypothetical protein
MQEKDVVAEGSPDCLHGIHLVRIGVHLDDRYGRAGWINGLYSPRSNGQPDFCLTDRRFGLDAGSLI